jgi:hypothetical protein
MDKIEEELSVVSKIFVKRCFSYIAGMGSKFIEALLPLIINISDYK